MRPNRKVGLVIGQLGFGGAERQLSELARRLPSRGFVPLVVSLSEQVRPFGERLQAQGVRVRRLRRRMHLDPFRVRDLRRILRTEGTNLVHSFLHTANFYCFAALLGSRGIPRLCSVRNCEIDRGRLLRAADRIAFRGSAAVLANSNAVREFVVRRYGIPSGRIRVVPNGLDTGRFTPPPDRARCKRDLGIPPEAVVVGGIGRLEPQKRFGTFLDLAARIGNGVPPVHFLVAGEGRERDTLERRIREIGLAGRFHLLPPTERVESLFSAMDIFLQTSYKEGMPNVVMEAMAMELPCVVTDAGGSRELVQEGRTGFVVPVGRDGDLLDRLRRLLADAGERERMGRTGRGYILDHYSVDAMVAATVNLYGEILARRKG